MLISQISRRIRFEHDLSVSPQELNLMLIKTGDLVETGIGKVETAIGRKHGICGEYREPAGSKPYWCPLYEESAQNYVIDLALKVFADRIEKTDFEESEKDEDNEAFEWVIAQPTSFTDHEVAPVACCKNCMSYINEECGMPRETPCTDYKAAYVPTAAEIEAQKNAAENTITARNLNQNALGWDVER